MAAGKLYSESKIDKTRKDVSKVKKEVDEFCRAVVTVASMNKRVGAINYRRPTPLLTLEVSLPKDIPNCPPEPAIPTCDCTTVIVETPPCDQQQQSNALRSNATADRRCTKENLFSNAVGTASPHLLDPNVGTRATRSNRKILQDHDSNLNQESLESSSAQEGEGSVLSNCEGEQLVKVQSRKRANSDNDRSTVKYNFSKVPQVLRNKKYLKSLRDKNEALLNGSGTVSCEESSADPLPSSSIWIPPSRDHWYDCVEELTALCAEASLRWALSPKALASLNEASTRRSSAFLQNYGNDENTSFKLETPVPLTKEYIKERLDIDDPLRGYQVRQSEGGWLQGFVLWTNFTTWTRYFEWNSTRTESGLYDKEFDDHGGTRDETGELADELEAQPRSGDPMVGGVVCSSMAEISLVGGLGCGEYLLQMAIEDIARMGSYKYVILQATATSWSFYEKFGFIRVGAVCKYGQSDELCGYRHWTYADERNLDQRHGGPSYMMARKIRPHGLDTPLNNPPLVPTTGIWSDLADKVLLAKPTVLSWHKQDEYLQTHPNPYAAAIVELMKKGNAWWKQLDQDTYNKLISNRNVEAGAMQTQRNALNSSFEFDSPAARRKKRIKLSNIDPSPPKRPSKPASAKKKTAGRKSQNGKEQGTYSTIQKWQAMSKTNLMLPSLVPDSPLGNPHFRFGPGQKLLKQKFTDKPSSKDVNPFFFNKVVTPKNGSVGQYFFVVHYEKPVNQLTLIPLEAHGKFMGKLSHRTRYRAVGRHESDKKTLLSVVHGSEYDVVHSEMVTKTSCIHEEGWNLLND